MSARRGAQGRTGGAQIRGTTGEKREDPRLGGVSAAGPLDLLTAASWPGTRAAVRIAQ
jgi:hypothetical protein